MAGQIVADHGRAPQERFPVAGDEVTIVKRHDDRDRGGGAVEMDDRPAHAVLDEGEIAHREIDHRPPRPVTSPKGAFELAPCPGVVTVSVAQPVLMPLSPLAVRELPDAELVERARAGESTAFDALALRYQGRLAKLVGRYVNDPADVLDVVQEALTRAYRALDRFRGDSAFYTWLYRIAVNTAKNYLAAQRRRPMDVELDLQDPEQYDLHAKLKETDTPEGVTLSQELNETVQRAIEAVMSSRRGRPWMVRRLDSRRHAFDSMLRVTGDVARVSTLAHPGVWAPLLRPGPRKDTHANR